MYNEGNLNWIESSSEVIQNMNAVTTRVVMLKKTVSSRPFVNLDNPLVRRSLYQIYMMFAQKSVINRKELEYTLTNAVSKLSVSMAVWENRTVMRSRRASVW